MNGPGRNKKRRSYSPAVEALEALRLLSGATTAAPLDLAAEHGLLTEPVAPDDLALRSSAWDAALVEAPLSDLLGPARSEADAAAIRSGLEQLDRYLSRAWYRAGIAPQQHDDCSQAVYMALLQNLGRDRFDGLVGDIGRLGVREVLSRETAEGPDFFRAVDTVKKRAQRERCFQPLDEASDLSASGRDDGVSADWRAALEEAIDRSLSPREAALIYATLKGETPMEIASQWGVAPKTVSNEKTRVIQKLRDVLVTDLPD